MSTHIVRYCRLLAVALAVSPWAAAFAADAFPNLFGGANSSADSTDGRFTAIATDSTAGQYKLTGYSPCVPEPRPCPPGQGTGGMGLQGSPSGGLGGPLSGGANESSTSPNESLLGGEQFGATGGGPVAVSDSPGGYIDCAIIGNVLRFRTDLAFNDENPDLAEFIYAECACISTAVRGPGPQKPPPLKKINYQELSGYMELSYSDCFSAFLEVPVRLIQFDSSAISPSFDDGGLGDINFGGKYAVIHNVNQYLTGQMRVYVPSGNSYEGLGTGHATVEPAILWWHRMSDRLCVQAEFRDWIPIGDADYQLAPTAPPGTKPADFDFQGNVLRYGFGAGYDLITPCRSECTWGGRPMRFTAVGEIVGWDVLGGKYSTGIPGHTTADAAGFSVINSKIGGRLTCGDNSFYFGWGHALTEQAWYHDIARFELTHCF